MKNNTPFTIYFGLSVLGMVSIVCFPGLYNFLGASSIVYGFLLGVTAEIRWLGILNMLWTPVIFVGLIISYITVLAKGKYSSFLIFVGMDLAFSIWVIVYKLVADNYTGILEMLVGFFIRSVYFVFLIKHTLKLRKSEVTS